MRKAVGVTYGVLVSLATAGLVGWHVVAPGSADTATRVTASPLPSDAATPWGASGTKAPVPSAAKLDSAVEQALQGHTGSYRVSVVDVATGKQLVDRDAATAGTPASSLKLLTGSAALATLGHDTRMKTSAVLDDDTLWLTGGGDNMLGAGASDEDAINGHAGLGTLAKKTVTALKKRGVTHGTLKVGVDASMFPGPGLNPDWTSDLVSTNNITEVQTPAMYAGRSSDSPTSAVVRNPANAAQSTYLDRLKTAGRSAGLDVTFTGTGHREAPQDGKQPTSPRGNRLAAVESATVLQQLEYMENHSDNFLAETYGRLVAVERGEVGDIDGATSAVSSAVKSLGVDTSGLDMHDTSGLASQNQVSPSTLAHLLAVTQTSSNADLRQLAPLLPTSGATGTLAGRLTGPDAKGLVRAKTGTLADVISLSGLVTTQDGRLLSFSVMASGVRGALPQARAASDAVAEVLLKG